MSEISGEYIESITKEELEAAGYTFWEGDYGTWNASAEGSEWFAFSKNAEYLMNSARKRFAPRKQLAEAQAQNEVLQYKNIIQGQYIGYVQSSIKSGETPMTWDFFMKYSMNTLTEDERERAAKLMEG